MEETNIDFDVSTLTVSKKPKVMPTKEQVAKRHEGRMKYQKMTIKSKWD